MEVGERRKTDRSYVLGHFKAFVRPELATLTLSRPPISPNTRTRWVLSDVGPGPNLNLDAFGLGCGRRGTAKGHEGRDFTGTAKDRRMRDTAYR